MQKKLFGTQINDEAPASPLRQWEKENLHLQDEALGVHEADEREAAERFANTSLFASESHALRPSEVSMRTIYDVVAWIIDEMEPTTQTERRMLRAALEARADIDEARDTLAFGSDFPPYMQHRWRDYIRTWWTYLPAERLAAAHEQHGPRYNL